MDASKNTGPRAVVAGPSFSDNSHSKTFVLLSRLIQLNDQVSGSDRNATTH